MIILGHNAWTTQRDKDPFILSLCLLHQCPRDLADSITRGCLFLPNEEQQTKDLCGYMNENKIELAFLTFTVAKNLFLTPSKVPTLKTLYTGGEPFSQTLLERWSPKVRLVHLYGSAESCAYATMREHVTTVTDPNNIGDPLASLASILRSNTCLWLFERRPSSQPSIHQWKYILVGITWRKSILCRGRCCEAESGWIPSTT